MSVVRLGEVSNSVMGQAPPGKACNKEGVGTPFVKAGEFDDRFPVIREWTTQPLKHAREGDVLICVVGATAGKINQGIDCAIGRSVAAIRPDDRLLDTSYLYYFMRQKTDAMRSKSQGLAQGVITRDMIADIEIPLPSLDEQKRIAAILDQADDLRRKRQRAIDRLNQLGQAIYHEMFGNISGTDTAWKVKPLADLCDLVRGSSPRPQGDPRYFGGPVPRLMIADITRDGMTVTPRIDSLTEEGARKSRPMPAGSVVMAVSGAVGLPAILSVDACIHDGFVGFRNLDRSVLPEFFYWYLRVNREQNKSQGTGAIWVNLTTDQVKRFNVPVPPISLQERFVTKMKEIAAQGDLQISNLNNIDRLFASIQNRAFLGEL